MFQPILSIQSHVVFGHVGNSAAVFPLQRLGREVWPLMTVQFSSHAGYPGWRGRAFDAGLIDECVAGLQTIGVLSGCAGLLTGYLGTAEIGEAAMRALRSARRQQRSDLCLRSGHRRRRARAICRRWRRRILSRPRVAARDHRHAQRLRARMADRRAGCRLARRREAQSPRCAVAGRSVVVAKSLALDDTPADALERSPETTRAFWRLRTPKLPIAVNGPGDLFAALFLHHWLRIARRPQALSRAASSVHAVVAATEAAGSRELALIAAQDDLVRPSRLFAAVAI